jgi:hypothetical protein
MFEPWLTLFVPPARLQVIICRHITLLLNLLRPAMVLIFHLPSPEAQTPLNVEDRNTLVARPVA